MTNYLGPVATAVSDFAHARADLATVLDEAARHDHEHRFGHEGLRGDNQEPPAMITSVRGEIVFHARFPLGGSEVYVREEYHDTHIRIAVLISGEQDYVDIFRMILNGSISVLGDIGTPPDCFASLGDLDISNISVHGDGEGKPYLIATRNIRPAPFPDLA